MCAENDSFGSVRLQPATSMEMSDIVRMAKSRKVFSLLDWITCFYTDQPKLCRPYQCSLSRQPRREPNMKDIKHLRADQEFFGVIGGVRLVTSKPLGNRLLDCSRPSPQVVFRSSMSRSGFVTRLATLPPADALVASVRTVPKAGKHGSSDRKPNAKRCWL